MDTIRVLIVDSSMVNRYLLADELMQDPMIQVVGNASEIRYALVKITQYQPDVVVLDVELPAENGLKMLTEMRKVHPKLPIIMFCTRVKEGTKAAMDALTLGATDFAAKPSERDETKAIVGNELIPKIKRLNRRARGFATTTSSTALKNGATSFVGITGRASLAAAAEQINPAATGKTSLTGTSTGPIKLSATGSVKLSATGSTKLSATGRLNPNPAATGSLKLPPLSRPEPALAPIISFHTGLAVSTSVNSVTNASSATPPAIVRTPVVSENVRKLSSRVDIVAIGVSTGGPKALAQLLPCLQKPFPVPVVIVQHMPKQFSELLAARLSAVSGFTVKEGKWGDIVRAGEIYLAPGGSHMEVQKTFDGMRIHTHEGPMENSCRPSVDVLFRSVAKAYGAGALGIVLTGMGQDGLGGSRYIRDFGGTVFVQDEASSVVWGMPGAVYQAELADRVFSLDKMPEEINRSVTGVASSRPQGALKLAMEELTFKVP
jgi:two-component system chemotaxis response regulator CheB